MRDKKADVRAFKVSEVAEQLRMSLSSTYDAISAGTIRSVRIVTRPGTPGLLRVPADALTELLAQPTAIVLRHKGTGRRLPNKPKKSTVTGVSGAVVTGEAAEQ